MKRLFSFIFILALALPAAAQDYEVASVTGDAFLFRQGTPGRLSPRQLLGARDTVLISKNSALAVIARGDRQLYSLGENGKDALSDVIRRQKTSSAGRFAERFITALRRGDTDKISHEANVNYKDVAADMLIYSALCNPAHVSAYPVSMKLVSFDTGEALGNEAPMGCKFFFRITNGAQLPLFVNVLDMDSEGGLYDCLPIDEGGTMLHLLIPGGSTVDLREHPMEFAEPPGQDRLVLVAYEKPFDLRNVIQAFGEDKHHSPSTAGVGTFVLNLKIR